MAENLGFREGPDLQICSSTCGVHPRRAVGRSRKVWIIMGQTIPTQIYTTSVLHWDGHFSPVQSYILDLP